MIFLLLLAVATCAADHHKPKENSQKEDSKVTTVRGVVDQVGLEYVIAEEQNLEARMVLRAEGFSPDNFARYVGQRVQVEGRLSAEGDRKFLTVRNLASLKALPPDDE